MHLEGSRIRLWSGRFAKPCASQGVCKFKSCPFRLETFMRKIDLSYTAGLFDGEGTVTLCRKSPKQNRSPRISIPSCTYSFMVYLKRTFGGCISTKRRYKSTNQPSWVWSLTYNAALNFLASILPYMKEPRKIKRTKLLLTRYRQVTQANGCYTPKELVRKRKFEEKFFSL